MDQAALALFLQELSELSRKHRIEISGCGCCDSPSLGVLDEASLNRSYGSSADGGCLTWDRTGLKWDGFDAAGVGRWVPIK
jgi:hypothetical protein